MSGTIIVAFAITTLLSSVCGYHKKRISVTRTATFGVSSTATTATACSEKDGHACIMPSRELCDFKLSKPMVPWMPIPWWYHYCKALNPVTKAPVILTSTDYGFRTTHKIIIALHLTNVLSKRRYISSSEESIENLIYYKDCNHRRKDDTTQPTMLRAPAPPAPPTQECKMCCSMCCGDECTHNQHQTVMSRQSPIMPSPLIKPQPIRPPIPQPMNQKMKKKKPHPGGPPTIDARRKGDFTREHIRGLISQDQDIRKILKDLVRVTMQKVDLMDMINSRRATNVINSEENRSEDFQE